MNCFIGVEENGILSGGKWLCQILLSIQGFKVLYFICRITQPVKMNGFLNIKTGNKSFGEL